jgi:hypothetical protein
VGAEYIIMEKAPGVQLFAKWKTMNEEQRCYLVQYLANIMGEIANYQFPAYGSLYLRESMAKDDASIDLSPEMDPSGMFCVGPSCDKDWYAQDKAQHLHPGPCEFTSFDRFICFTDSFLGTTLSDFGTALANREIERIKTASTKLMPSPPRGSTSEQIAALEMAKQVFSKLDSGTFFDRLSQPVLWHTDLHMGNIFVCNDDPTKIVSIIDWQSVVISPMSLQVRFPNFIPVDEDYNTDPVAPKLPENYDHMSAEDKEAAVLKWNMTRLAKAYQLTLYYQSRAAYNTFSVPLFCREFFHCCGEVAEQGDIPLRSCLTELAKQWDCARFSDKCPFHFSEDDIQKHERQLQAYRNYGNVRETAKRLLETDMAGWIAPQVDFRTKQRQNMELLQSAMSMSDKYNLSPEGMRDIWPFLERS